MSTLKGVKIMVDLDDTLWDLTRPWVDLYNTMTGDNLAIEEILDYKIANYTPKMGWEDLLGLLTPDFYLAYVEPYPHVAGRLNRLRKEGAELIFATHSSIGGFKEGFLDRFGLLMPGDTFVESNNGDKTHIIESVDVVIDDKPATILAAGISKTIIPNRPWNLALNSPNWTRMLFWVFASVGLKASDEVNATIDALRIATVRNMPCRKP